jgi:DNA-binding response OmpR family regulator
MNTVLLLDDNSTFLKAMTLQLEYEGYKVLGFNACLPAMEFVNESPTAFGVVIADLHLPDASGLQLLEAVREVNQAPFFIMTGQTDFDVSQVTEKGGQGVLYKPINRTELFEKLRTVTESNLKT